MFALVVGPKAKSESYPGSAVYSVHVQVLQQDVGIVTAPWRCACGTSIGVQVVII